MNVVSFKTKQRRCEGTTANAPRTQQINHNPNKLNSQPTYFLTYFLHSTQKADDNK